MKGIVQALICIVVMTTYSKGITHNIVYNVTTSVTCTVGDTLKFYGTYSGDYTASSLSGTNTVGTINPTMVSSSPFYLGYLIVQGSETTIFFSEISQGQRQIDVTILSTTGIEESIKSDGILFHPNPFNDFLVITADYRDTLEIHTCDGGLLITESLEPGKTFLDLRTLKSGIYLVKTKDKSVKIIKE